MIANFIHSGEGANPKPIAGFMMRSLKENWHRLVVVGLVSIFATDMAYADTYNFFFKDKPKKGKKHDNNEQADVSISDDEEPANTKKKHKAINPLTAPASGHEDSSREPHAALDPGQLPPIIINNTNNVAFPQGPPPTPQLTAENEPTNVASDVGSDVELMAGPPTVTSSKPSPWRFGAGLNLIKENRSGFGGSLSIAHVKERGLGFNFFAGIRDNMILYPTPTANNWHLGGEMELMMVRSGQTESGIPVFEGGLLLGASTLSAHPDNWVSLHTGLRMNLNFKNNIGVALVGRVNLGYTLAEAAIITRL